MRDEYLILRVSAGNRKISGLIVRHNPIRESMFLKIWPCSSYRQQLDKGKDGNKTCSQGIAHDNVTDDSR